MVIAMAQTGESRLFYRPREHSGSSFTLTESFHERTTECSRDGGPPWRRHIPKLQKLKVEKKGHNDFVSDADRAAEAAVIEVIKNHYPDHAILAEESGSEGESDTVWIIDPLDGTTNFLHGFPQFCVSVGVQINGRMEAAAVYDPMRQEIFAAARGEGATLDGRKIRVSGRKEMEYALIGTGSGS